MSVMLSFGLALGSLAYKQQVLASGAIQSQYAFYAADAALECALYADQRQNLFAYPPSDPPSAPAMTCDGSSAPVSATKAWSSSQWIVTSRLSFDSGTRCADVTVYKPSGVGFTYLFSQGYDVSCTTVETPAGARFSTRGLQSYYLSGDTTIIVPPNSFSPDSGGTLADGLVAYWPMDESSGIRSDVRGASDFSESGGTIASQTGTQGNAADFTASNGKTLVTPDSASISSGDIDFTIAFWVYFDTLNLSTDKWILNKNTDGAGVNEYHVLYDTGVNKFRFLAYGAGSNVADVWGGPSASAGQWYFVTAYHDAANNKAGISVNNSAPVETSTTGAPSDTGASLRIGGRATSGFFDGRVDEVGIWKRILTSQERSDLYNAGAGNTYTP